MPDQPGEKLANCASEFAATTLGERSTPWNQNRIRLYWFSLGHCASVGPAQTRASDPLSCSRKLLALKDFIKAIIIFYQNTYLRMIVSANHRQVASQH